MLYFILFIVCIAYGICIVLWPVAAGEEELGDELCKIDGRKNSGIMSSCGAWCVLRVEHNKLGDAVGQPVTHLAGASGTPCRHVQERKEKTAPLGPGVC